MSQSLKLKYSQYIFEVKTNCVLLFILLKFNGKITYGFGSLLRLNYQQIYPVCVTKLSIYYNYSLQLYILNYLIKLLSKHFNVSVFAIKDVFYNL